MLRTVLQAFMHSHSLVSNSDTNSMRPCISEGLCLAVCRRHPLQRLERAKCSFSTCHKQSLCVHAQSRLTLWHPVDYTAHQAPLSMGLSQARIPEWVAISYSRGSSWPRDRTPPPLSTALAGGFFSTESPGKLADRIRTAGFSEWEETILRDRLVEHFPHKR